jgi:hypothetical protein
LDLFYYHQRKGSTDTEFKKSLEDNKDSIKLLADNILGIIDKYFKDDKAAQQNAFEPFAQGLLFDNIVDKNGKPRRPEGDKIHMMDSGIEGFVVFHTLVRALTVLGLTDNKNKWQEIDMHVALAAAILGALKSGSRPEQN